MADSGVQELPLMLMCEREFMTCRFALKLAAMRLLPTSALDVP